MEERRREYIPNIWVIVKIPEEDGTFFYKVLGGWSGGYLTGDSWRLNSGITHIKKVQDFYEIYGESGSVYICHEDMERVGMSTLGILSSLKERGCERVDLKDLPKELFENE